MKALNAVLPLLMAGLITSAFGVARPALPDDPSQVVAIVDGKKITLNELEAKQTGPLLDAGYRYYLAQREALNRQIDEEVLQQQAKKEGITETELLKRHVDSKVKDPSDDALRVYYEGVETDKPYSEVRDKIRDHIRHLREQKLRAEYLKSLRAQDTIQITLLPPSAVVALGDAPVRGPETAPVLVIEYADYQCPYCRQMEPSLSRLLKDYPGKVRIAFKDFPLPMHPAAEKAAEAARCAGDQGKYWAFHDVLYSSDPTGLAVPQLKADAGTLKLDSSRFDKCLDSGADSPSVRRTLAEGTELGITGTPAFFINGRFVSGAVDYQTLQSVVQEEIAAGDHRVADTAPPNQGIAQSLDAHAAR